MKIVCEDCVNAEMATDVIKKEGRVLRKGGLRGWAARSFLALLCTILPCTIPSKAWDSGPVLGLGSDYTRQRAIDRGMARFALTAVQGFSARHEGSFLTECIRLSGGRSQSVSGGLRVAQIGHEAEGRIAIVAVDERSDETSACAVGDEVLSVKGLPAWQLGVYGVGVMLEGGENCFVELRRSDNATYVIDLHREREGEWRWRGESKAWETSELRWLNGVRDRDDLVDAVRAMHGRELTEGQVQGALEAANKSLVECAERDVEETVYQILSQELKKSATEQERLQQACNVVLAAMCVASVSRISLSVVWSCPSLNLAFNP